ncbi:MAG: hypothetical protein AABY95_03085 [Pseudomonadota bacterium]
MKYLLSALLITLFSANAWAADTVTPHTCKKPKVLGRAADMEESKRFEREFGAYKNCIVKYVKEHGDLAQAHQKAALAAKAEIDALVAKANAK